jgi:tetratricopeptide (TPR) repeat protein
MRIWFFALVLVGVWWPVLAQNPPAPATSPNQGQSYEQRLALGIQFYSNGYFNQALLIFERLVKENSVRPEGLYWLSRTQLGLSLLTPATENVRRCIAQNASYVNCYIVLSQVFLAQFKSAENKPNARGYLDQALAVLKDAERVNNKYAPIYGTRGPIYSLQAQIAQASGDNVSAESLFIRATDSMNKAISLDKDNATYRVALARIYLIQGKPEAFEQAAKLYDEAIRIAPKDGSLRLSYGNLLLVRGECDKAMQHLEQAIILTPGNAEAWTRVGEARYCNKKWKEAGAAFENAVALTPVRFPESYAGLGKVYMELADGSKAKYHLTKAVALDRENPEFRYLLGRANEMSGDKKGAKAQCEKALELRAEYPAAQECVERNK